MERTNNQVFKSDSSDSILSFAEHTDVIVGRTRKLIYVFKNLKQVANKELIIKVYLGLGQSQLSYCISTWGGAPITLMLKVEASVLLWKLAYPYRSTTQLLKYISSVKFSRQLYIMHTVTIQHSLLTYDPKVIENRKIRIRKDIVCSKPIFNTYFAHRFICFQGCNLYNKINRILSIYWLWIIALRRNHFKE